MLVCGSMNCNSLLLIVTGTSWRCCCVRKNPETISKDVKRLQNDLRNIKKLCEKFERNFANLRSRIEIEDEPCQLFTPTSITSVNQRNSDRAILLRSLFIQIIVGTERFIEK